jgi:hypothetical protein
MEVKEGGNQIMETKEGTSLCKYKGKQGQGDIQVPP